ncbi:MAG: efflux RND transporter permease subunit, partial [Shimia sp.]
KGFNLIDTVTLVRQEVAAELETWPPELSEAVDVTFSNDTSREVESMVEQLQGSVLTAIALVMIVVLSALGTRSALLVGFAIPTSFLLCFALLAAMGITISNIVMFGLILAVGMLVDGAIVVVEYADKRMDEGAGPMEAYTDAAKRMFWPIVSSTATTLCAFLPMLFWPGVPGEFMGMLPVTLIYVLSASLLVALVYLPVMGGVSGRFSRWVGRMGEGLRVWPWLLRAALVPVGLIVMFAGAMQLLRPGYLFEAGTGIAATIPGAVIFLIGCVMSAIFLTAAEIRRKPKRIRSGHQRTMFGRFIKLIAGNPIMPLVTLGVVGFVVVTVFSTFGQNNNGVEFFVETEPEQAIVYVRARGNLSLEEKDDLLRQAEAIVVAHPAVQSTFSFAGGGGLNANTGGGSGPSDEIAQAQIELVPWEERPIIQERTRLLGLVPFTSERVDPRYDGTAALADLRAQLADLPGIQIEILNLAMGPASPKPVSLRLKGDDWDTLVAATATARTFMEGLPGLVDVGDNLPLPGIDWQIDVDVEEAGRYGADVSVVGAMVRLVTRGITLDTMRVPSSDTEIDIRVRFPEDDRVLSTLDTLRVRTANGLVPLSNFIERTPVPRVGTINRVAQTRYFDVSAAVAPDLAVIVGEDGARTVVPAEAQAAEDARAEGLTVTPLTATERVEAITEWLETDPLPLGVEWEWAGDQDEQAESGAFLMQAFAGALGLMFIILLAQFNSVYNSILVLTAVVLSTTGVLIGMLVMDQAFSIIMTGTGIVALAGIVVNNNIVLIDTYQEFSRYMPRIEAIVRTAEARIRPVLLTTITTMAGLAPMMFGLSLDFIGGGYTVNSPTALWWIQLATAVVWGLGTATILTLVFTPSMLALRVWATTYVKWIATALARLGSSRGSRAAHDWALRREARRVKDPEIVWEDEPSDPVPATIVTPGPVPPLRAAE